MILERYGKDFQILEQVQLLSLKFQTTWFYKNEFIENHKKWICSKQSLL